MAVVWRRGVPQRGVENAGHGSARERAVVRRRETHGARASRRKARKKARDAARGFLLRATLPAQRHVEGLFHCRCRKPSGRGACATATPRGASRTVVATWVCVGFQRMSAIAR
eukprot:363927-Chlamydomonas_euryale.AAC.6